MIFVKKKVLFFESKAQVFVLYINKLSAIDIVAYLLF